MMKDEGGTPTFPILLPPFSCLSCLGLLVMVVEGETSGSKSIHRELRRINEAGDPLRRGQGKGKAGEQRKRGARRKGTFPCGRPERCFSKGPSGHSWAYSCNLSALILNEFRRIGRGGQKKDRRGGLIPGSIVQIRRADDLGIPSTPLSVCLCITILLGCASIRAIAWIRRRIFRISRAVRRQPFPPSQHPTIDLESTV